MYVTTYNCKRVCDLRFMTYDNQTGLKMMYSSYGVHLKGYDQTKDLLVSSSIHSNSLPSLEQKYLLWYRLKLIPHTMSNKKKTSKRNTNRVDQEPELASRLLRINIHILSDMYEGMDYSWAYCRTKCSMHVLVDIGLLIYCRYQHVDWKLQDKRALNMGIV